MFTRVLIIERNEEDRKAILHELKKHRLNVSVFFKDDEHQALEDLCNVKESQFRGFPQILILNLTKESIGLIEKVRSDFSFNYTRIYLTVEDEAGFMSAKENLMNYKIAGIVKKPIKFKSIANISYLDSFSLYLDLLKIQALKV